MPKAFPFQHEQKNPKQTFALTQKGNGKWLWPREHIEVLPTANLSKGAQLSSALLFPPFSPLTAFLLPPQLNSRASQGKREVSPLTAIFPYS